MLRVWEREEDKAAPSVPEDNEKAAEVFLPRLGPDTTRSISPGYKLCSAILAHDAGVPSMRIHSPISPSLRGLEESEVSPDPSGSLG